MLKWTVALCISMYAVLLVFGQDKAEQKQASVITSPTISEPEVAEPEVVAEITPVAEPEPEPVAEVIAVAATPAPLTPVEAVSNSIPLETDVAPSAVAEVQVVSLEPAIEIQPEPEVQAEPEPAPPALWQVTGQRVNLREGPSTGTQIVGRTVYGDNAELIEMLPTGWARVYILESGVEAYISAKFIAPQG